MRKPWPVLIVGALLLSLFAVGCGGDDASAEAIPKATYLAKAEKICEATKKEIEADITTALGNQEKTGKELTEDSLITIAVIPDLHAQIKKIKAIGLPEGEEDLASEAVESMEELVENAEATPSQVMEIDKTAGLAKDLEAPACSLEWLG